MGSCCWYMKLPISLLIILWSAASHTTIKPGTWELLVQNASISSMHMTTTHLNTVIMFDRTDFGPSQLRLDRQWCRDNPYDRALTHDCWVHFIEYNITTGRIRPLMVMSDTWCSSGAFATNGTLVHTGGFNDGERAIRHFAPCLSNDAHSCDWVESHRQNLIEKRWYASDQILPDDRIIVVDRRRAFSYEFMPKTSSRQEAYDLPFLRRTNAPLVEDNLYPFLHLS